MCRRFITLGFLLAGLSGPAQGLEFPLSPRDIARPVLYEEMEPWLRAMDEESELVSVTVEGESVAGRSIHLVRLSHGVSANPWKVLAIGAQHGNEHSGKDALLYMIHEIVRDPSLLSNEVELYIIPMANPDGVNADQRRNGNGADLNRDHTTLFQPETQAIHRVQQRVRAHVVIDCHEYTRDGSHFLAKGWKKWPLVTLGTVNSPYVEQRLVELSDARLERAHALFADSGVSFMEYLVGGLPPEEELRPSTPDADDVRNGLGAYGSLAFIIEAGIFRGNAEPQEDFGPRVAAYRDLLWELINGGDRTAELDAISAARGDDAPAFLPTNYFWATSTARTEPFPYPVLDAESGETLYVPTAAHMRDLVIKNFVPRPVAYAIDSAQSEPYAELLERHAIPFERLEGGRSLNVEQMRLIRVEDFEDQVYGRYAGRQIVERKAPAERVFEAGTLIVPVEGARIDGRRATLLLEPMKLYGLYQYQAFLDTVGNDGILPVYRVMQP